MEARGPEALLLAAHLAEHRAIRRYADLEMNRESSMYVEVCVRASLERPVPPDRAPPPSGVWGRLRAALHRGGVRAARAPDQSPAGVGRAVRSGPPTAGPEPPRLISAAGIARTEPFRPPSEPDGPALSLAFQPLLRLETESSESA